MSVREILAGRAVVELGLRNKLEAGLKAARAKLQRFSSSLSSIGSSFAGIGGAAMTGLGAPLAAVGVIFGGFDGKMAEVAAVSGSTGAALDGLREKAKQLGATTRFSATEAAEGMKYLAMAGMSAEQIMDGIGPVLMTAAAGGMELGRAADIISDVTTAFGLSATQTARVADVLAATATSSNTSIEQMGEAFTYAAAQGKAAGQTVEDVSAALGILGNSGLKASIAGSGVQGIFKRLIQPDAIASLRQLGVSIADSAGNIRPLSALMSDLAAKTAGMTQLNKLQKFEELFGLHAKSAIILADNSAALGKMTDALQNADGKAAAMAATMNNSVIGQFLSLKSAAESVLIEIGEAIKGPMMAVLSVGAQVGRAIAGFVSANKPLVKWLGIIMAAGAAAGAALMTLGVGFMGLAAVIASTVTVVSTVAAAFAAITLPALGTVAAVTAGVAAFTALAGVYVYVASQAGIVSDAFGFLGSTFNNLLGIARQTFGGVVDALAAGQVVLAARTLWAGLKLAFLAGASSVLSAVKFLWKNAWTITSRFYSQLLTTSWKVFSKIPLLLKAAFTGGKSFGEIIAGALSGSLDLGAMMADQVNAAKAELQQLSAQAAAMRNRNTRGQGRNLPASGQGVSNQNEMAAMQANMRRQAAIRAQLRAHEAAALAQPRQPPTNLQNAGRDEFRRAFDRLEMPDLDAEQNPLAGRLDELRDAQVESRQTTARLASDGTFSAAGAMLMGVGTKPMEETARNTAALLGVAKKQLKQKPAAQPAFAP